MSSTVQTYSNSVIINMEGGALPRKQTPLNCGFFMLDKNTDDPLGMNIQWVDDLHLSFFELNRPADWVGRDRELVAELDAPGCYITKPAPVPE